MPDILDPAIESHAWEQSRSKFGGDSYLRPRVEGAKAHALIAQADDEPLYVIKIPRIDTLATAEQLRREVRVAEMVAEVADDVGFALPCPPTDFESTSPYAVVGYVPGKVFGSAEIRQALSLDECVAAGYSLGQFVARMGVVLPASVYSDKIGPFPGRPETVERWLEEKMPLRQYLTSKGFPTLSRTLEMTYQEYQLRKNNGQLRGEHVVQGDLHGGNITFMAQEGAWRLHGVFDFDSFRLGNPAEEFQPLRRMLGREATAAAARAYAEITGNHIDLELVEFLAGGKAVEWAVYNAYHGLPIPPNIIKLLQETGKEINPSELEALSA